jgi:hypothetical protein
MKAKNLHRVVPDLVQWYSSLSERIPQKDFEDAVLTASRIARRGRGTVEYEILINTSTFNLLRQKLPWIQSELEILKVLLVEAGVFQKREDWRWCLTLAQGYLAYTTPRTLLLLQEIHRDHSKGPGLVVWKKDDETTCVGDDDYQREILDDPTYRTWCD